MKLEVLMEKLMGEYDISFVQVPNQEMEQGKEFYITLDNFAFFLNSYFKEKDDAKLSRPFVPRYTKEKVDNYIKKNFKAEGLGCHIPVLGTYIPAFHYQIRLPNFKAFELLQGYIGIVPPVKPKKLLAEAIIKGLETFAKELNSYPSY